MKPSYDDKTLAAYVQRLERSLWGDPVLGPRGEGGSSSALRAFVRECPGVRLSVDTALRREWALAGLLDDPEPNVLGCGGAQRHVALTPGGDVYPCSHARRAGYAMGNLLVDAPSTIWASGQGVARYLATCQGGRVKSRAGA
ncbi:MAG TPA: SPASM domain-containing protein [Polyangiaceae bacterium]|nr:SPASM domain-containing protein [Polyangiaceae bacterium]